MDGSRAHTDLYSAIRRYIDPSSAAVRERDGAAQPSNGIADAAHPSSAERQGPRKRPRKGPGKKRNPPPPPPPPQVPDQDASEDDDYDDEDAS